MALLSVCLWGGNLGWAGGVITNCSEASLRAALAGGGVVNFGCDGVIVLSAPISITADTVLDGGERHITISGNHAVGLFQVLTNISFGVANVTLANGRSTNGAGLRNEGGTVNVNHVTFADNQVLGADGPYYPGTAGESVAGGALANFGVVNLVNCTFTNNAAIGGAGSAGYGGWPGFPGGSGSGGAIWNSGLLRASGCTFAGNSAGGGAGGQGSGGIPVPWPNPGFPGGGGGDGLGGAIFNGGAMGLANCTLALNRGIGGIGGPGGPGYPHPDYPPPAPGPDGSPGLGVGGIHAASGQCALTNCTVALNAGPGIRTIELGGVTLVNTVLAENSGGSGAGEIVDLGHNLSSDLTCAFTNQGSLNLIDPQLGPLTDHGGPTPTMALLPGSPAIDGGTEAGSPVTDQRGLPRPVGVAPDIGAYEYGSPAWLSISPGAGGGVDLIVFGRRGQTCCLWVSESLLDWQPAATNHLDAAGMWALHHPGSGNLRFYRVVLP
jgi:hypothetical protein